METKKKSNSGRYVIVRTQSAGVHCGTLVEQRGMEVVLEGARRIWYWTGANTLHEISLHGVAKGSKVSETVERIALTQAIEIIDCADDSRHNLKAASWS